MSRKIAIASLIWGMSILLSRVIGLVREAAIGRVLGGGGEADVYLASFGIPDFLNHLLAGGALSIVFIPIFGGYLARGQEEEGWKVFSVIANLLLVLIAIGLAVFWVFAPELSRLVAPGFDAGQLETLTRLTRILLPAQAFHVIGGLLGAVLQARDKHTLPALAPLVYTVCVIAGGLLAGPELGADGFAWGVVVGSVLGPFGLPLIGCLRGGLHWRLVFIPGHPDLKTYLVRSLPVMVGFSIVLADDWFLRAFGSMQGEGAVATVQYAKTLMRVPMGVFGMATGVAAYPTLTRLIAQGQDAEAYATLSTATRRMLILAFASQVALTAAGAEIARVIYGARIPDAQYAEIGQCLSLVSLGLWAWAAQTVVSRGFWARGKTWGPTLLGTAVALLCLPLYLGLAELWGTAGLALASSVAMTVYVIILMLWLRRSFPGVPDHYGSFFLRVLPAVAVGVGVGMALDAALPPLAPLLRGGALALVSMAAFVGAAALLRVPDLSEVIGLVTRRLRRRRAS